MAPRKKAVPEDVPEIDNTEGTAPAGPISQMSGAKAEPAPEKEKTKKGGGYNPVGKELKVYAQFKRRKDALLQSRFNVYGLNIDEEMRRFDKLYFRRQADIPASELDPNQRPVAINNAYGKIQTALGILVDSSPKYMLEEDDPKYTASRALLKALGEKSLRNTNSFGQFKLSVFNAAKRGWFVGRTYNKRLYHDARFLKGIDAKGRMAYETKTVTKIDDIAYVNINNYNAWLDEQTKPEDFLSTRDWMWREVWYIDDLRRVFPEAEFPNMKFVEAGGDTRENISGVFTRNQSNYTGISPQASKKGMTEVFFYENWPADQFIIQINGVMVVWEPLPQNNKRLSCVYGQWHLRGDDTPYGIGIIEEMENDEELVDRILNMSMRQLLLSIAPMGFYTGTEDMEDENIRISPGILRRTLDPKNIAWMPIPSGDKSGLEKIEWLESKQDDKTGITPTIQGADQPGDQTAFQVGVEREAGLKRLSLPLKSLQYALAWEFENRIALIQQVYSDFTVDHLADDDEIQNYLKEVNADPDFYFIDNEGQPGLEKFYAKRYRKVKLNIERTEGGDFVESENEKFFHIKPSYLAFSGFVTVDPSTLLTSSESLDQANVLRMTNMLIPLFQQPPELAAKPAKQMLQAFRMDPNKWLPQQWLDYLAGKPMPKPPAGPADALMQKQQGEQGAQKVGAETLIPPADINNNPSETAIMPPVAQ